MNRPKAIFLLCMILLLTGCTDFFMICSLNPFYLDKNITLAPAIEGRWSAKPLHMNLEKKQEEKNDVWKLMDTTSIWKIERRISRETLKGSHCKDSIAYRALNFYRMSLIGSSPDSSVYQFKMVLFRVKRALYADFMPVENTGLEKSRFASESYFKIHTLARVIIQNGQLQLSWLGASYMKDMIEKKRVRINYRWISDAGRLLLTGSSGKLTGMIEHYAGEPRFIDWDKQPAMLKLNPVK